MNNQIKTGLIIIMIFLSANTFAQTNEIKSEESTKDNVTEKTYLSFLLNMVNTNLNYGKSNSSLDENKKTVQGIQIGASFQAGITPKLSLVTELYFIMKGGRLKEDKAVGIDNTTLRLYTIELPVLARFDIGKVYVDGGPSIAYTLWATKKIGDISKNVSFNKSSEGYKRWDAGVQMGAGYRFKIKQKPVALDVRYSYGLSQISYGQEMHNRYLNVGLYITNPWRTNPLAKRRNS
ncbi:MAG: porin family protein [Ginsengibacter sp.]